MQKDLEVDNQRPDEEIILLMRQHPWVLAKSAFILIIVILVIFLSFFIWKVNNISLGLLIVAIIFMVIYIAVCWYSFANNIFILTNQRLIKIDQKGYFNRKVSEAELDNIHNVNYEIKGIIKSLLNFGDIKISTVASETSTIIIDDIENPHYIQEKIMDLHKKYKIKIHSN